MLLVSINLFLLERRGKLFIGKKRQSFYWREEANFLLEKRGKVSIGEKRQTFYWKDEANFILEGRGKLSASCMQTRMNYLCSFPADGMYSKINITRTNYLRCFHLVGTYICNSESAEPDIPRNP